MPIARFQMPDGRVARFEVPEGTSPEQAHASISKMVDEQPTQPSRGPEPRIGRTILDQTQQGLTFGFGDEISDVIGSLGAGAYMKAFRPDLIDGNSLKGLYNEARGMSRERLSTEMSQSPGLSIGSNIVGSVATGVPRALLSSLRTGGLAARVAKGGATGAVSGATYGAGTADEGSRLEGAKTGALLGGGISAAIPVSGAAASTALKSVKNAVLPTIEDGLRPVVELAQKYKIPVAMHQVTNSNALKNFQKVSKELPFSGENAFREKQIKAWQGEVIKTAGGKANKFTPELMDSLFTKVGKEFDDFGKGKSFDLNDEFIASTKKLMDESEPYSVEGQKKLQEGIAKIYAEADENGVISGEKLGKLRQRLNADARKAAKIKNYESAEIFHDLENTVVDIIKAGDDEAGRAFSKTKQKYKNLLVVEPLAAKAKAGNISPTELKTRVSKIYGREFVRGNAGEIGDLARIGNELLPELGGSDTVPKAIIGTGAATAILNPAVAIANAGKAATILGGNRFIQSAINRNQNVVGASLKKSRLQSASKNKPKITTRPQDKLKK